MQTPAHVKAHAHTRTLQADAEMDRRVGSGQATRDTRRLELLGADTARLADLGGARSEEEPSSARGIPDPD